MPRILFFVLSKNDNMVWSQTRPIEMLIIFKTSLVWFFLAETCSTSYTVAGMPPHWFFASPPFFPYIKVTTVRRWRQHKEQDGSSRGRRCKNKSYGKICKFTKFPRYFSLLLKLQVVSMLLRGFSARKRLFSYRVPGASRKIQIRYIFYALLTPHVLFFFYFYVFLYRFRPSCDVKWPLLSFYIEHKQIAATLPFRKMETRERTLYFYVVVQIHEACETSARLLHVTKRFYPALNAFTRH